VTRARRIALFGAAIPAVMGGALAAARLRAEPMLLRNVTPSMPLGLYRRTDDPVTVGAVVAVRQPVPARAYLRSLGFPSGAVLLKRVVVAGRHVVCASGDWVQADGLDLVRLDRDRLGQALPRWDGCRRLASDELFLKGDDARSFDSRYFGPVSRSDVVGVYERVP
jgi:type IV secretory pathway protease TraF